MRPCSNNNVEQGALSLALSNLSLRFGFSSLLALVQSASYSGYIASVSYRKTNRIRIRIGRICVLVCVSVPGCVRVGVSAAMVLAI